MNSNRFYSKCLVEYLWWAQNSFQTLSIAYLSVSVQLLEFILAYKVTLAYYYIEKTAAFTRLQPYYRRLSRYKRTSYNVWMHGNYIAVMRVHLKSISNTSLYFTTYKPNQPQWQTNKQNLPPSFPCHNLPRNERSAGTQIVKMAQKTSNHRSHGDVKQVHVSNILKSWN